MAEEGNKRPVDTRLLQAEFELAKSGATYSVIDLAQNKITIKAAGVVLRSIPIVEVDIWGHVPGPRIYRISEKKASKEPERIQIEPGKEQPAYNIDALERDDMPVRYTMVFEDGINVSFSSDAPSDDGRLAALAHATWGYISRPLVFLWKHSRDEKHSVIDLKLDSIDCQSVYWALPENSATLFILPK